MSLAHEFEDLLFTFITQNMYKMPCYPNSIASKLRGRRERLSLKNKSSEK